MCVCVCVCMCVRERICACVSVYVKSLVFTSESLLSIKAKNWSSLIGGCLASLRFTLYLCQSVLKCARCSAALANPALP